MILRAERHHEGLVQTREKAKDGQHAPTHSGSNAKAPS